MNRTIATVFKYWIPLLGLNAVIAAATLHALLTTPKVWTAQAQLILPDNNSDLNADLGTLGNLSDGGVVFSQQLNPLKILSSILLSEDTLREAWKIDPEKDRYERLSSYAGLFDASPQAESTIISLNVEGSSPEVALERTGAAIQAFQQRLNDLRADDASQRRVFLQKELKTAAENLDKAERDLETFKETSGLVSSNDQTQQIVQSINALASTQAQLAAEARGNQAEAKMLSSRIGLTPDQAIRSLRLTESSGYQSVKRQLAEVDAAIVEAQALLTDEHPQVQLLLSQRAVLVEQVGQYIGEATGNLPGINTSIGSDTASLIQRLVLVESQEIALQQQSNQLGRRVAQLDSQLRALPAAQSRLLGLQRQFNISEGVYNGIVAKVQEAKLNAFSTYPSVQVLDQPSVDVNPSGPNQKVTVLGALIASLLGSAAIILLLEKSSPLLTPKDLETLEVPVLSNIPRLKSSVRSSEVELQQVVEFQRLASAISMLPLENRRLLIGSASLGEGKTTVTQGLAIALVTLGFKVLLVDGDFRKAELSKRLGYSQFEMPGLGFAPLINIRPNLDFVPTIPQTDAIVGFIAQGKFEQFLSAAQSTDDYDYVLIDSAPVELTSETLLMIKTVSNVLLVVSPGNTNRDPFRTCVERLTQHKANITGMVVNGVDKGTESYLYKRSGAEVSS